MSMSVLEKREEGRQVQDHLEVEEEADEEVPLPGFRFHPTDEELVGFYLRRKVEKKSFSIDIIKQVDIYKHDPWDLPKLIKVGVGENECYFFCLRGRKYRNSIRPNRVTGSGYWKATGIDKKIFLPIGTNNCIGLKKSLVYYRGKGGKGTKTCWMMHEFRLPPKENGASNDLKSQEAHEAENWTICRIFERNAGPAKKSSIETQNPIDRANPNFYMVDSMGMGDDFYMQNFEPSVTQPHQGTQEDVVLDKHTEEHWNDANPNYNYILLPDDFDGMNWEELARILDCHDHSR